MANPLSIFVAEPNVVNFSKLFLHTLSHLICTLISENEGLEKLRSASNLRKISGPAQLSFFSVHLNFFSVCHLIFFQIYTINLKKSRWQTEKKLRCTEKKFRCAGPEIFLRFETDLNFSRPWFSEIKVQIKWPTLIFAMSCAFRPETFVLINKWLQDLCRHYSTVGWN